MRAGARSGPLLVFLAVLPQFATPRGIWPLAVQLAILGVVFTLTCGVFYLIAAIEWKNKPDGRREP